MRTRLLVLSIIAALGVAVMAVSAALAHGPQLQVAITKAPVTGDGTTAGAVTDIVLTFVDTDPNVSGIGIEAGGQIVVTFPDGFVNTGDVTPGVAVLQGWQASPRVISFPPPVFLWTTTVTGNTVTIDMNSDYLPIDSGNPGPKQVHLLLDGFLNPGPGTYDIGLSIAPDGDRPNRTLQGTAVMEVIPRARPNVNIVSVLSGNPPPPPFKNVQYQTVTQGPDPDKLGLYLWDRDTVPFVGVDAVMVNPDHYRLVQGNRTVGQVWIEAPNGASGYALTTPDGASTETVAAVSGLPTAKLITQFSPDPTVPGSYVITFSMNNGNTQQQFVDVVPGG